MTEQETKPYTIHDAVRAMFRNMNLQTLFRVQQDNYDVKKDKRLREGKHNQARAARAKARITKRVAKRG